MKCKNCKKEFHYCINCDYDFFADHGFCSEKCLLKSPQYKIAKDLAQQFFNSLTITQRSTLKMLYNNMYDLIDRYFEGWIKEIDIK